MDKDPICMTEECARRYQVIDKPDGGVEIYIDVPKRFRTLWLVKLTELFTNDDEIKEYGPEDYGDSY